MVSPSHGSLEVAEWALLYRVYIESLMISKQISLYEHNFPNKKIKMGKSEDLESEIMKSKFHLIIAINIATSWTVSMDDAAAFADQWKQLCLSNQHLFPKKKRKYNHHLYDHILELFQH
ncbi:hypothetical protein O181_026869 [Austropuccinia psidii MF-1]|uniref:Uncharacterized protein n=1 Tax=Austropuccinia psidii MF-1 TaxID=1389203 RepID=A0A9Q3CKT1_9BASI|nr:hypothetical protein [Austropuccinia psidii MF-1]